MANLFDVAHSLVAEVLRENPRRPARGLRAQARNEMVAVAEKILREAPLTRCAASREERAKAAAALYLYEQYEEAPARKHEVE